METTDSAYPVRFDIDYPEEPRNRLTSAFRRRGPLAAEAMQQTLWR